MVQRSQQEELQSYRENQEEQLKILKETNEKKFAEYQKAAEEAAKMDVSPEIQQKAAKAADIAIQDMADKMSVRFKRIELYQRCGVKNSANGETLNGFKAA